MSIIVNKEKNINELKEIAKRIEQRADDDSVIPTGGIGRYSDMYNNWMKAGIIFYNIGEYELARNCFFKSHNYVKVIENYSTNYNILICINLCDKKLVAMETFNLIDKYSYNSKIYANNFIKTLEKTTIMENNLNKDFKKYIQNLKPIIDTQYMMEILFNPVLIVIFAYVMYYINK